MLEAHIQKQKLITFQQKEYKAQNMLWDNVTKNNTNFNQPCLATFDARCLVLYSCSYKQVLTLILFVASTVSVFTFKQMR